MFILKLNIENESTEGQNNNYVEIIFCSSFFVYANKKHVYQHLK